MKYREIGATGKRAGIIGLGCEHLDRKPFEQVDETIGVALDHGVNYFDVFMPGAEVRQHIARAMGERRRDIYIQGMIGSTDIGQQYDISRDLPVVQRYFEDMLRTFGGYVDFGMLFFIDSEEDYEAIFANGIVDYARALKEKGDIGHIGFSSHKADVALKFVETGVPEVMLFSINLAFDMMPTGLKLEEQMERGLSDSQQLLFDLQRSALYQACAERGVGISVMKSLGAGKLISAEHTPFGRPMTVNQCTHYALSKPGVFSVLPGCSTGAEMRDSLSYLEANDEARDFAPFLNELPSSLEGHCVYCNHCLPCPVNIDIAAVHRYLDIARLDEANVPPSIVQHYRSLEAAGADCIACGSCEARCPFGVEIISDMAEADRLLGV